MTAQRRKRTAVHGRQYAFAQLVGKLPLTTPMSTTWNVHGTGVLGHIRTFDTDSQIVQTSGYLEAFGRAAAF